MIFGLGDDDAGPSLSLASPAARAHQAALLKPKAKAKPKAETFDASFIDSLPLPAFIENHPAAVAISTKVGDALGLPPRVALLTVGLAAAGALAWWWSSRRGGGGKRARNPKGGGGGKRLRHSDPEVQRAIDFRESFHWGHPTRSVSSRKVYPRPRVLVELGKVHAITYRTRKKGESASLFEHEFEGTRPTLTMDIRNRRLHIVGGSYGVTDDGITG